MELNDLKLVELNKNHNANKIHFIYKELMMSPNQPSASANSGKLKSLFPLFRKAKNRAAEEEQGSTFNQYSVNKLPDSVEVVLIDAVKRGDTTVLGKLLEKKIDVCKLIQLTAFEFFSPIHQASENKDLNTFIFLLDSLKEPSAFMQADGCDLIYQLIKRDQKQFLEQLHVRGLLPPGLYLHQNLMINEAIKKDADNVFKWLLTIEDSCTKSDQSISKHHECTFDLVLHTGKYKNLIKLMIKRGSTGNKIEPSTRQWLGHLADKTIVDIANKIRSKNSARSFSVLRIMFNYANATKNERLAKALLEIEGRLSEPESVLDKIRNCPRQNLMKTLEDIAKNSEQKKCLYSALQAMIKDKSFVIDDVNWILQKATEKYCDEPECLVRFDKGLPLLIKTCIDLGGETEPVYRLAMAIGSGDMDNFSKYLEAFTKQDYAGNKEVALTSLCEGVLRNLSSDQAVDMLKALIEEGANPDQVLQRLFKERDSDTGGQLNRRDLKVIELLLVNQRVLPNHTVIYNYGKPTLLEYALYQGFFDAAKLLIKFGADVDRIVAKTAVRSKTPDATIREKISYEASNSKGRSARHFIELMKLINKRDAVINTNENSSRSRQFTSNMQGAASTGRADAEDYLPPYELLSGPAAPVLTTPPPPSYLSLFPPENDN